MKTKMVNWSIKLGLVGLTTIATTLAIMGCDVNEVNEVEASADKNIKIYGKSRYFDFEAYEIVDEDTGVHYLIVADVDGISVTPMYSADGSLKIN